VAKSRYKFRKILANRTSMDKLYLPEMQHP
jgi:hypothetical protein